MGTATDPKTLYDEDFHAWTQEQARVLRQAAADRLNVPLDLENLAEEVEGMGRAERRAVEAALACVVEHLLKLDLSPAADAARGRRRTIRRERRRLERLLEENPSLAAQGRLETALKKAWPDAADEAVGGMEDHGEASAVATMPTECPYGLRQIRDVTWFPGDRHGIADRVRPTPRRLPTDMRFLVGRATRGFSVSAHAMSKAGWGREGGSFPVRGRWELSSFRTDRRAFAVRYGDRLERRRR